MIGVFGQTVNINKKLVQFFFVAADDIEAVNIAARPRQFVFFAPVYFGDLGCDVAAWAKQGWVDFVSVSEFLFERGDLPIAQWRDAVPGVPLYGGIECTRGGDRPNLTADEYRAAASALSRQGVDGVYLFNFFTSREGGEKAYDPPFDVLDDLGAQP